MVKLNVENGKVTFLMYADDRKRILVQNDMSEGNALALINSGKLTKSDNPDFPICVDDKFLFPGEFLEPESEIPAKPVKGRKERNV